MIHADIGPWKHGRRSGQGTSLYGGKWGYDRWVGPFVDDLPHGSGTMYLEGGSEGEGLPFDFEQGEPVDR